jgi:hypothetical protein
MVHRVRYARAVRLVIIPRCKMDMDIPPPEEDEQEVGPDIEFRFRIPEHSAYISPKQSFKYPNACRKPPVQTPEKPKKRQISHKYPNSRESAKNSRNIAEFWNRLNGIPAYLVRILAGGAAGAAAPAAAGGA